MASNLIMNGVTYSGTPANPANPYKPSSITVTIAKIGITLESDSGKRRFVSRDGATKMTWAIGWEKSSALTKAALRTLHALTTTWTFVDELGVSYTVQTEQDDYQEDYAFTDRSGNLFYGPKLTVREA